MRAESRLSWLAVAAGSAMCAAVAAVGADARWLAALGGLIAEAGRIPSSIPYAAAPSADWVNVPVLGELIFRGLTELGGDRALVVAQAVAVAAMLTIVAREMRAAGATDASRALVLLAIPIAGATSVFIVRAQLFSLPLFALTVALLRTESREPTRRIWLLVPLVALWSNLHGAVLTGVAVASVYLVLDRTRHERWTALGVLAAAWGALFATPALARTPEYYWRVLQSEPAASGFGMWGPLSLRKPFDVLFVVVALSLLWLAMRARLKGWELVCLVLLIAAAVHSSRNSIWLLVGLGWAAGRHDEAPPSRAPGSCSASWSLPGSPAHRRRRWPGRPSGRRRPGSPRDNRSSRMPRTPSSWRSTGAAFGSRIPSTRSRARISVSTSGGWKASPEATRSSAARTSLSYSSTAARKNGSRTALPFARWRGTRSQCCIAAPAERRVGQACRFDVNGRRHE